MNQPIKTAPPLVPQPLNKQSALLAQLNSTSKVIISDPLGNIIIPLEDKNLLQAMASTGPSGTSAGKTATKMAMDHQATLDKGLKMKIKRTKPGTKTSEAKHEIVKAELNGTAGALIDDTNNTTVGGNNKKHSQITATSPAVAAATALITATATPTTTPTAQGTKRGSSGHRREKTREKSIHSSSSSSQRDKNEHNSVNSSTCQCTTHELQVNGVQTPCSSLNCIKNRTTDLSNNSNSQRINTSANQTNNTNNLNNSNSAAPISTNNLFSTNNCNSTTNSSVGSTANTPGPPNLSSSSSSSSSTTTTTTTTTTSSSTKNLAATISNLTQQQQQTLNQTNSNNSIKSQTSQSTGTVIGTTSGGSSSSSSSSILSSSTSSSSNSSTSSLVDDKRGTSPPPAKKMKTEPKEMIDMCVGTSVGTITEPDCLGPCEPGTAVTLEGIVWHETEGGVLVVNVTWRGKTYVGTLLDCTRHDWAPPR